MSDASLQDLRDVALKLRGAGKRGNPWAPFYTTGTYYLASACDEILLNAGRLVRPLGSHRPGCPADGLARVGSRPISADIAVQSPPTRLTKSKMSPEQREQVTWLLGSNHQELVRSISREPRCRSGHGRRRSSTTLHTPTPSRSRKHVVDGLAAGGAASGPSLAGPATEPGSRPGTRLGRRLRARRPTTGRGRYVAIIRIEGTIVDGRTDSLPIRPPIDIPLVGQVERATSAWFRWHARSPADKNAAAAVLFINSRGGSSTASEAMRQSLELVAKAEAAGDRDGNCRCPLAATWWRPLATGSWRGPGTLTGSIGVFTGKLVTSDLFSKLFGQSRDRRLRQARDARR